MPTIDGLQKLIDKEIDRAIPETQDKGKYFYKEIATVENIDDNSKLAYKYNWVTYGGSPTMQNYTDHGDPNYATLREGYKGEKDYGQKRIAYAIAERTMRKATNSEVAKMVKDKMVALNRSINRTIERAFFDDLFNNGTTTLTPDGVAIYSTSHPIKNAEGWNSDTTWSNYYSTSGTLPTYYGITSMAFGFDQVSAAKYEYYQMKALDGHEIDNEPALCLVPTSLEKAASQVFKSKFDPSSANQAYNMFEGFDYATVPRLTNSTTLSYSPYYFIGDKSENGLKVLICKSEIKSWYEQRSREYIFDAYLEFAVCAEHPQNKMRCEGN